MMYFRPANQRGRFKNEWLDTHHSFSFGSYYDPKYMGVSTLRVINDDRISPAAGFPTHPHNNMEIVTYVMKGALAHKDSMGNGSVIKKGDVQRMSAGTGITHSEFNASQSDPIHLLQIWLLPSERNISPSYEQRQFSDAEKQGRLRLLVSPDGRDDSMSMTSDSFIYGGLFAEEESAQYLLASGRVGYIQIAEGAALVNGKLMQQGDGLAFVDEPTIEIVGAVSGGNANVVLFDLPK